MLKSSAFSLTAAFAIGATVYLCCHNPSQSIRSDAPPWIVHLKSCSRCNEVEGEVEAKFEPATSCPEMQRIRLAAGFPIRQGTARPGPEPVSIEPVIASW